MKKDIIVVHTRNKSGLNVRFNNYYIGEEDNFDRITLVGKLNQEDKTMSVGLAFCNYPDNFDKYMGTHIATLRASSYESVGYKTKPYQVVEVEDFTLFNCLDILYKLHNDLTTLSIKEVLKEVSKQVVK